MLVDARGSDATRRDTATPGDLAQVAGPGGSSRRVRARATRCLPRLRRSARQPLRNLGDTPLAVPGRPRSTHRDGAALRDPASRQSSGYQQRERAPDQRSARVRGVGAAHAQSAHSGCMRASPPPLSRRLLGTTGGRAVRPCADDRNRGQKRAPTGGHRRTSRDRHGVPERTPPPPRRPTGHAPRETTTGRRRPPPGNPAARHRRPAGDANGRPQPATGAPSSPARRPDRLAVYMGCCANRGENPVIACSPAA